MFELKTSTGSIYKSKECFEINTFYVHIFSFVLVIYIKGDSILFVHNESCNDSLQLKQFLTIRSFSLAETQIEGRWNTTDLLINKLGTEMIEALIKASCAQS